MLAAGGSAAAGAGGVIVFLFLLVIGFAAYFAPSIVAYVRHVRDMGSVIVINALLGWTLVGWAVALAMALRTAQVPTQFLGQTKGDDKNG